MNIVKRIIYYLNLKDVGFLELIFAATPLLSGYSLGSMPLSLLMWPLLVAVAIIKRKQLRFGEFRPMKIFITFWALHLLYIFTCDNINIYGVIEQSLTYVGFFVLLGSLNPQKVRGSLNIIALISIIGLLHQWSYIVAGGEVHPLELPILSMPQERLETFSIRPSSFFMEPAAYVSFIFNPLAFAIMDKKYIWSIVLILSVFLTTSTTGLITSFIMLGSIVFTSRFGLKNVILVVAMCIGLLYALSNMSVFGSSVEKFNNTDTETNVRLTQGTYVVSQMRPEEYIIGVPHSTAYNFCMTGRAPNVIYYGENVFMPTFWNIILLYGIVGILLYLNVFWKIYRKSAVTLPYILCLLATLFSGGPGIYGNFVFAILVLLMMSEVQSENIKYNI